MSRIHVFVNVEEGKGVIISDELMSDLVLDSMAFQGYDHVRDDLKKAVNAIELIVNHYQLQARLPNGQLLEPEKGDRIFGFGNFPITYNLN